MMSIINNVEAHKIKLFKGRQISITAEAGYVET
jgi:hypothetical protein